MAVVQPRRENLKKFFMPSTSHLPEEDQLYVVIDMQPFTTADMLLLDDSEVRSSVRVAKLLASRIKEWNLTLPDGTPLDVNFDNFCLMQPIDFNYLRVQDLEAAPAELSDDQKKS